MIGNFTADVLVHNQNKYAVLATLDSVCYEAPLLSRCPLVCALRRDDVCAACALVLVKPLQGFTLLVVVGLPTQLCCGMPSAFGLFRVRVAAALLAAPQKCGKVKGLDPCSGIQTDVPLMVFALHWWFLGLERGRAPVERGWCWYRVS